MVERQTQLRISCTSPHSIRYTFLSGSASQVSCVYCRPQPHVLTVVVAAACTRLPGLPNAGDVDEGGEDTVAKAVDHAERAVWRQAPTGIG